MNHIQEYMKTCEGVTSPRVQVGKHQRLVEGNFTEEVQQLLNFELKHLVRQRIGGHQLVVLLQACRGQTHQPFNSRTLFKGEQLCK